MPVLIVTIDYHLQAALIFSFSNRDMIWLIVDAGIPQSKLLSEMSMSMKQEKWIKARHHVVTAVARAVIAPYTRVKYGVHVEPFKEQKNRQYLVLYNHQTPFDQFFIGMAFHNPVYYLATEDIFSLGWVSDVLRYLVAPIPIKKQTTDVGAIRSCVRVAKEGGTIAIAPEGNRTYSGRTEHINPSIASLVRILKLPVALFRIEGGYGIQPRWSDCVRKGKMRAYVSRIIEPEEYETMTIEELFTQIQTGLDVRENCVSGTFTSPHSAEYLERAIYVCPECGLSTFESHDHIMECKGCRRKVHYLPTKELHGVNWECPFRFVADWYDYQSDFVNHLNTASFTEKPLYQETARLFEVILYKRKKLLRSEIQLSLYGNRMVVDEGMEDELLLPFEEVSAVVVLGRNKLNVYHNERVYQFKGDKHFNALKYVHLYFRHKNICKGDANGKFLGL